MADLIDRQEAIRIASGYCHPANVVKELAKLPSAQQTTCKYWDDESSFCALHRPSAQSEIIRCKDCKHGSPNGKYGCTVYHFQRCETETHEMKSDDFCSRAER